MMTALLHLDRLITHYPNFQEIVKDIDTKLLEASQNGIAYIFYVHKDFHIKNPPTYNYDLMKALCYYYKSNGYYATYSGTELYITLG